MTDTNVPTATTTATPEQEMAVLLAQLAALSRSSLDITRACIDLTATGPSFVFGVPQTPDELDALFPPGRGDNQVWHVVTIGRNPGFAEADDEVLGIPNQHRRRKTSRQEALAYYRHQWGLSAVIKLTEAPVDLEAPVV
ncbi:hypothetical protein DFH07DRAFT_952238 [Mycena maculata]|uniref:Uncharacterized protein n=1 Tax=Mycena maculata TaxID=230809 RepID=A0AAD7JYH5_9AGAR|nr:hypothetical protein DFH07DRAFT_952238 [Mycena maculata]